MHTYLRILAYSRRYPLTVAAAVALSIVVAVLYTSQIASLIPLFNILFDEHGLERSMASPSFRPYVMAAADVFGIDLAASGGFTATVELRKRIFLFAVIGLVGLLIVLHVLRFAQEYVVGLVVQRSIHDINCELYRRVIRQPVHFFRAQGSADIVSRFTNDAFMVASGTKTILEKVISEPLKIVGVVALACYIDPYLTMMVLVCMPVAGGIAYAIGRKVKKMTRRMLKGRSRMIGMVREVAAGIRIVKVARAEGREVARFDEEAENIFRQNMGVTVADAAATPLMVSLTSIVATLAVVSAGFAVFDKRLDPGKFMAFYAAIFGVLDPVRRMASIWNKVQSAVAAGERVFEYIDLVPDTSDPPVAAVVGRLSRSIELKGVTFNYNPTEPVLRGLDLVINKGETVAFVGRSGAGKSTLISLIPRFYDPTSGAVYLDGIDLREIRLDSLRSQIGLVTQEPILFHTTIADNIRYARPEATEAEVIEAARAANAHEFIVAFEKGYQTIVGDDGATLSGGQRQRLAIARAILANPSILILDEASSSLDSVSEAAIQDALDRFVRGRTTLVIAHRLSTIERADKIVVLEDGRIEAVGPHRQLLDASPTYRQLHAAQWRGA